MKPAFLAAALLALALPVRAADAPIPLVAAQNFYGEAAQAIGGDRVSVTSVIVAPGVDPHDFEPGPADAKAIADARIVIMNGADYDHWVEHALEASERPDRVVIDVAALIGVGEGQNPHVWYDPAAMPALATALASALKAADPEGAAGYDERAAAWSAGLAPLDARIAEIKGRFAGAPVTATEPVFGPMAAALGLEVRNEAFQQAIMNEVEPSARDIAAMEDDLRAGRVKALIYNAQVSDPLTEQLLAVARAAGVPVVSVSETKPEGVSYVDWMVGQLDAVAKALAAPAT